MFAINVIAAAICLFFSVMDMKEGNFGWAFAGLVFASLNGLCLFI